jgi:hypothetical protein
MQIDVWAPALGDPEISLKFAPGGVEPIALEEVGNISVSGITPGGGLQISKDVIDVMALRLNLIDTVQTLAALDRIRITQKAGNQVYFRYHGLVDQSEGTINNRSLPSAPYNVAYTIGVATRVHFEAPCILEFPQNWQQLVRHCPTENVQYAVTTPELKVQLKLWEKP